MSETIFFYNNRSPAAVVNKHLTELSTPQVKVIEFRGDYDTEDPELIIGYNAIIEGQANYAWIRESGRYYYADKPVLLPGGRMMIRLHIDLLMTYKEQLKGVTGIIHRNSELINKYITDQQLPLITRPYHGSRAFARQPLQGGNAPLKWYLLVGGGVASASIS